MGRGNISVEDLLNTIVGEMVDTPDEIRINVIAGDGIDLIELRVADGDVGKIIGKFGTQADALRRILMAVGGQRKKIYKLEIQDNRKQKKAVSSR